MIGQRLVRGVVAAGAGALVGAALTRAIMRLVILVAGGTPQFTWTGSAFIGLFHLAFLLPGALALAWSRARWPLVPFALGAIAIPVQAIGIAQTDLAAVGPFTGGQWALLVILFALMAAGYAAQAVVVYRVARSGRGDRQGEPAAPLVGAGGGQALG